MKKAPYRTKQQQILLDFIKQIKNHHFTADDISRYLKENDVSIGVATIYRQLEKFVNEGIINKYIIDEKSAACFEYIQPHDCDEDKKHFHLKCESCGKLFHVECEELEGIQSHLEKDHNFILNPFKTVFYGICKDCINKEKND